MKRYFPGRISQLIRYVEKIEFSHVDMRLLYLLSGKGRRADDFV